MLSYEKQKFPLILPPDEIGINSILQFRNTRMRNCLSPATRGHNDYKFDHFFPERIRTLSKRHWTPHLIVKEAADFLACEPGARILDVGSGIGKFCLVAGYYFPDISFYGIEQREELIQYANEAKSFFQIKNAHFIHGNFTEVDFNNFDHFYFYNSFYENLDITDAIDNEHPVSADLYKKYTKYLFDQLCERPRGTKLVTFDCQINQIPACYRLCKISSTSSLKMWIK